MEGGVGEEREGVREGKENHSLKETKANKCHLHGAVWYTKCWSGTQPIRLCHPNSTGGVKIYSPDHCRWGLGTRLGPSPFLFGGGVWANKMSALHINRCNIAIFLRNPPLIVTPGGGGGAGAPGGGGGAGGPPGGGGGAGGLPGNGGGGGGAPGRPGGGGGTPPAPNDGAGGGLRQSTSSLLVRSVKSKLLTFSALRGISVGAYAHSRSGLRSSTGLSEVTWPTVSVGSSSSCGIIEATLYTSQLPDLPTSVV